MPYYDYYCGECGLEFEGRCSVGERDCMQCPECGEIAERRVAPCNFKVEWLPPIEQFNDSRYKDTIPREEVGR